MTYLDEVIGQVAAWDAARDRSQQKALGWSQIGGCRRYMGYRLDEEWATDDTDIWRAVAGTALHLWLQQVRRQATHGHHLSFEVETEYQGVPGHIDELDHARKAVTDYKFPSLRSAAVWDDEAVLEEKFVQPQGYAAGALENGALAVDTVRLLVCPVDGTFEDWKVYERPFDQSVADVAVERYMDVLDARENGFELPRDKPRWWCERFCEFFSLCRGGGGAGAEPLEEITDAELAAALERYGLASEVESAAKAEKARLAPLLRGLHGRARGWKVTTGAAGGSWAVDEEQIAADYYDAGREVPRLWTPKAGSLSVRKVK